MRLRRRSQSWAVVAAGVLAAVVGVRGDARAERRALVIANARYRASGANLLNPGKDARRVAAALEAVGFEKANVTLVENLTRKGFRDAVGAFARRLQPGDEAFVYYSGHGIAIEGTNYLLGVDFNADNAADARYDDVYPVTQLIERLEIGAARLRVVVVDACRDQPFTKSWSRSAATRGFVAIPKGSTGTLVAFAAADGEPAADNADGIEGGPYAYALARLLTRPGLEVHHLFRDVGTEVWRLTKGRQRPDFTARLDGDFFFLAPADGSGAGGSTPSVPAAAAPGARFDGLRSGREVLTDYEALDRERREAEERAAAEVERRARTARERAEKLEKAWATVEKAARTRVLSRDKRVKALEQFLSDFPEDNPHAEAAQRYQALLRAGREPNAAPGDMVEVPAGEFFMGCNERVDTECDGDEKPGKRVNLPTFYIDRTEVTVDAYAECVRAGRCSKPSDNGYCNWGESGRGNHPINCIDWSQADAFCSWKGKRLPTEAEWEKAARGTDGRKYPWGNEPASCGFAVMNDGGFGCGRNSTWPVDSKPEGASPYGALHMAGNVWEWTSSWYSQNETRVTRGGSWFNEPAAVRASDRSGAAPSLRKSSLGVRCAQSF